jgi:indole-3-glycerol phosphate synthase
MNILDTIIEHKKREVAEAKQKLSTGELKKTLFFGRPVISLRQALLQENSTGIIAEFKRRSPSKGIINDRADVVEVTSGYARYGASCLSVLTDHHFFGGSAIDLERARVNELPILRKDFIIDEYQLVESRAMGADLVLLIAACLSPARVQELARFAIGLGLEVLLEIHHEGELQHICDETVLVGVNNRDLKTFTVDINRSIELGNRIAPGKIKIAESGITDVETIRTFRQAGFKGFLIGERFMKEADPTIAFANFVEQLKAKVNES